MVPSLSPLSSENTSVSVPPRGFKSLRGEPSSVSIDLSARETARGVSAAQQAGLRFERKINARLEEKLGNKWNYQPRLAFRDGRGEKRVCIPDGIIIAPEYSIVVEIKISHMAEAWWQLNELYLPVLKKLNPLPWKMLEIVKTYDPAVEFPVEVNLVTDLVEWMKNPSDQFAVFVWA